MTAPAPTTALKPGYRTTEWWTVVAGNLAAIVVATTGHDVSTWVPMIATICALASNGVYALSRSRLKAAHAAADVAALAAAVSSVVPAALEAPAAPVTVPVTVVPAADGAAPVEAGQIIP